MDTWSRENLRVLTSINYDKMSFTDKLKESNPRADHDYGLSWIRRDGAGRVFYKALGHNERIYAMTPMLEHLLAGHAVRPRRPHGRRQPEQEVRRSNDVQSSCQLTADSFIEFTLNAAHRSRPRRRRDRRGLAQSSRSEPA